ncbi:MAG: Trp biosynthesis-associated membrane protein [Aeromicrobium sp.]|uniref:Trp biosynthesis-associated membrane protein n=1 Tax=Aeromicrobium sp. TaxID=1871063 RepID=UPI0039E698E1
MPESAERLRRWYGPVVLALIVTGGAAFILARRTWVTTRLGDGQGAGATIETTGAEISALVPGLAVVVLAGGLAVVASSGWLRRIIGGIVTLAALGGAAASRTDPAGVVDAAVSESVAFTRDVQVTSVTHHGSLLALALFVVAAVLGAVVVRCAAMWPAMSSRYAAPSAAAVTETDLWKALDAGLDPTTDPGEPGSER